MPAAAANPTPKPAVTEVVRKGKLSRAEMKARLSGGGTPEIIQQSKKEGQVGEYDLSQADTSSSGSLPGSMQSCNTGVSSENANPTNPNPASPMSPSPIGTSNVVTHPGSSAASPSQPRGKLVDGYAEMTDHMGTKISGTWKESKLHGKAVMQYSNGSIFTGECQEGYMEGFGEWKAANCCYKGMWKKGYTHGKGEFTWPDGSKYEGDWHWGTMWGNGVFAASDGSVYEGQFAQGKRHGLARIKFPNGDKQFCIWYCDKKWITYCYQYANGDMYKRNGPTKFAMDLEIQLTPEPTTPAANPGRGLNVQEHKPFSLDDMKPETPQ